TRGRPPSSFLPAPRARGLLALDAHDVDDEHEGVAAADPRLRDAALAVAELGRDRQQDARADLAADQALVPAGDDDAHADRERDRLAALPRGIEEVAVPDLAVVVDDDRVAGLDLVARALDEDLRLQALGCRGGGEG